MRIAIDHRLTLTPPLGTGMLVLQVLLTPRNGPSQQIKEWNVDLPGIAEAARFIDAFGNEMLLVNVAKPESGISVHVTGLVETVDLAGVLGRPGGEPVVALYKRETPSAKAPEGLVERFANGGETRLTILHGLMAAVGEHFGIRAEDDSQSQMQADGSSIQGQKAESAPIAIDAAALAHAFVGTCRDLDIPARLVTGYLHDAPAGISPFHVWAEAYDEGLGWIGFDPSIQLCPTDRHVRLAAGLDLGDAQPLKVVPASELRHDAIVVKSA